MHLKTSFTLFLWEIVVKTKRVHQQISESPFPKVSSMMAQGGLGVLGEKGWRSLHDHTTEGATFGMKTFYTQGGINHYKDGKESFESEPEVGGCEDCYMLFKFLYQVGSNGMLHYGQLVPKGRGERLLQTSTLIGKEIQLSSSNPITARELYLLSNQSFVL